MCIVKINKIVMRKYKYGLIRPIEQNNISRLQNINNLALIALEKPIVYGKAEVDKISPQK